MLHELELYNFRNFEHYKLKLEPGINLVTGANGSGKSSILEAIFYLARGRSFRTSNADLLIKENSSKLTVRLITDNELSLASERSKNGRVKHKLAGETCTTMLEISEHLPVLFLDTNSQRLLASGPKNRRQTIDWGLFYGRKASFYPIWRNFRRCLLQRNAAIKSGDNFTSWDELFINNANLLDNMRCQYVADLQQSFKKIWQACSASENWDEVELIYQYTHDLEQNLANNAERDRILGHTTSGPHRADLAIKISGKPASSYLSQGQQKLLTYVITIAQAYLHQKDTKKNCLLLLDDVCAELDLRKRADIINFLDNSEHQVLMTGIIPEDILSIIGKCQHIKIAGRYTAK